MANYCQTSLYRDPRVTPMAGDVVRFNLIGTDLTRKVTRVDAGTKEVWYRVVGVGYHHYYKLPLKSWRRVEMTTIEGNWECDV